MGATEIDLGQQDDMNSTCVFTRLLNCHFSHTVQSQNKNFGFPVFVSQLCIFQNSSSQIYRIHVKCQFCFYQLTAHAHSYHTINSNMSLTIR